MPQRMEWLIQDRIMLASVEGEVTADDFRATNTIGFELSETVAHDLPVHTIMDGRAMTKVPNMAEMLTIKFKHPRNTGWVVLILSTNRLFKFMGSTFSQMIGIHFRIVETWQDAVDILASVDPTLPDLAYLPEKMEKI
jgi:hypothetical protein